MSKTELRDAAIRKIQPWMKVVGTDKKLAGPFSELLALVAELAGRVGELEEKVEAIENSITGGHLALVPPTPNREKYEADVIDSFNA